MILLRNESAGGRPAGVHVSKIKRIELGPENVALRAQCGVRLVLLFAGVRVIYDPGQREVSVFGGLRQATLTSCLF